MGRQAAARWVNEIYSEYLITTLESIRKNCVLNIILTNSSPYVVPLLWAKQECYNFGALYENFTVIILSLSKKKCCQNLIAHSFLSF